MLNENFLLSRGERVREERERLGFTQQQAADICSVSRVQWGKYERGINGIDGKVLLEFQKIGADAGYILSGMRSTEAETLQASVQVRAVSGLTQDQVDKNQIALMFMDAEKKLSSNQHSISARELAMLENYRALSEQDKKSIERMTELAACSTNINKE